MQLLEPHKVMCTMLAHCCCAYSAAQCRAGLSRSGCNAVQLLDQDSMGPQSLANSLWALGVFQTTSNPTFRRCLERLGSVDIALISAKQLHQLFQVGCCLVDPSEAELTGLATGSINTNTARSAWPDSTHSCHACRASRFCCAVSNCRPRTDIWAATSLLALCMIM